VADAALFSIDEARAFGRGQLADPAKYEDEVIEAEERSIRQRFERIAGVAFVQRTDTELLDGRFSYEIWASQRNPAIESPPRPIAVTAAAIDGLAFTDDELADLVTYPGGLLVRRLNLWAGVWPNRRNVSITYSHGWQEVPLPIRRAALMVCCDELVASDLSSLTTGYSDATTTYTFVASATPKHWFRIPEVNAILNDYLEAPLAL
jgi:hypothetical protein